MYRNHTGLTTALLLSSWVNSKYNILKAIFPWAEALNSTLELLSKPCYKEMSSSTARRDRVSVIRTVHRNLGLKTSTGSRPRQPAALSSRESRALLMLWCQAWVGVSPAMKIQHGILFQHKVDDRQRKPAVCLATFTSDLSRISWIGHQQSGFASNWMIIYHKWLFPLQPREQISFRYRLYFCSFYTIQSS